MLWPTAFFVQTGMIKWYKKVLDQTERCDGMAEDIRMMKDLQHVEAFEKEYQRPDCIVLDSSYSSMGRMIAMKAC